MYFAPGTGPTKINRWAGLGPACPEAWLGPSQAMLGLAKPWPYLTGSGQAWPRRGGEPLPPPEGAQWHRAPARYAAHRPATLHRLEQAVRRPRERPARRQHRCFMLLVRGYLSVCVPIRQSFKVNNLNTGDQFLAPETNPASFRVSELWVALLFSVFPGPPLPDRFCCEI